MQKRILDGVAIKTVDDRHCSGKCPLFHIYGTCSLLIGTKWCLAYEYPSGEQFVGPAVYIRCKACLKKERKG